MQFNTYKKSIVIVFDMGRPFNEKWPLICVQSSVLSLLYDVCPAIPGLYRKLGVIVLIRLWPSLENGLLWYANRLAIIEAQHSALAGAGGRWSATLHGRVWEGEDLIRPNNKVVVNLLTYWVGKAEWESRWHIPKTAPLDRFYHFIAYTVVDDAHIWQIA